MSVRDGARYLRAAVDSILGQTYRDLEFIVIDDGSTDETPAILESYARADARMKVLHTKAKGITSAITKGIETARGGLIARMDADDIALPERFNRQIAFLAENPEILAVGSAIRIIDAEGRLGKVRTFPTESAAIARDLVRYNAMAHPTVIFRRDALVQAGSYREPFHFAQDYDLWMRISERGALANLPDVLLLYREHGGQLSIRRRAGSWLANALARDLADRRRRGLAEGLVPGADLATNARVALDRHLKPSAQLNVERSSIVLLMAESLAHLDPSARPLARAAIGRVFRFAMRERDFRLLAKIPLAYWRTSPLRRPASTSS